MLRIGKLTDYATLILANLAADRSRLLNAGTLSERTHIAAPTVAKLLKQLHRAGLVNSTRGTHGGYQLARDPESISAAAILDALEGPIALTECSAGSGHCDIEHTCSVGRTWQRISVSDPPRPQRSHARAIGRPGHPDHRHAHRTRAHATCHAPRRRHEQRTQTRRSRHRRAAGENLPPRLRHRHRFGHAAAGTRRGRGALHLAQEARAAVHDRLARSRPTATGSR